MNYFWCVLGHILSRQERAAFFFMHKGHSYFLSLNRGIEAYLFCMGSLAESAIAYRAECTLMRGVIKAQRGKKKERAGGWGGATVRIA